ncbi:MULTISPECIES: EAL domain-containing protein [unclassified Sphingopyxis]|uniref:EAL domain-containing protein n=1 Tax=unclassified Sphingopyxis TaxID=2614943 RepID=UPI000A60D4AA|nr:MULTISPECIES: EAL domain-containing protein [unclassified Sphingopyxis]
MMFDGASMRRRTIIIIASCLAILAAILPLIAIAVYARHKAVEDENRHLIEYADWTLERATGNIRMVEGVFGRLERENRHGCDAAHIARMRQLTIDAQPVDEVGYFMDGKLACTSWGKVGRPVAIESPDTQLPGGIGIHLNVRPIVTSGGTVHALSRGDHNILIKPERLVDVLTDTKMTLGVATLDGKILSTSGPAHADLVARIARHGGSGRWRNQMFASAERKGLRAFAITDRALVEARIDRDLWYLVPIGVAISAALVGLVLWLSRQRLSPRKELEIAIRRREFVAFYQPIIELSTGLCIGAEALARWHRPDGEWVAPDLFFPLAEQTGLVEPLTDLVIETVVVDLAEMLRKERSIHVAINISAADMQSGRFLAVLAAALSGAGIEPSQIWLEATERGFMNAAAARATIEQARAAGHLVAIDDFGTGYSSLSLLETLPLDALKIDKSFVDAIGKDAATSVIVPHIIEMAHGLNFHIVAEGVETEAQEMYLRDAGVEFAQGWRYSEALPADRFAAFYEETNAGRTPAFFEAR